MIIERITQYHFKLQHEYRQTQLTGQILVPTQIPPINTKSTRSKMSQFNSQNQSESRECQRTYIHTRSFLFSNIPSTTRVKKRELSKTSDERLSAEIVAYFYRELKNSDAGGARRDYLGAMRCRGRTYLIIRSVNRDERVRAHCLRSVHAQKEFLISKRRR